METNAKQIWDFLKSKGLTDAGAAGLMGNLKAESGLTPNNLQNNGNAALSWTDEQYTQAVDNGTYTRAQFINDGYGFGLPQWTFSGWKEDYYDSTKEKGASIGDLTNNLEQLVKIIARDCKTVWAALQTATDVLAAASCVLVEFERPADQSDTVKAKRAAFGQEYFDAFAGTETQIEEEDEEMRYQTVEECPTWAQATIKRLVENKELAGTGTGLDLTHDMCRVLVIAEKIAERKV